MPCGEMNPGNGRDFAFPWELATFAMLALSSKSYSRVQMKVEDFKEFINFIRKHMVPEPQDYYEAKDRVNFHLIPDEIMYQENRILRFLRYHYLLTFSNDELSMPNEILSRFGVSSDDILKFLFVALVAPQSHKAFGLFIYELCQLRIGATPEFIKNVMRIISLKQDVFAAKQRSYIRSNHNNWQTAVNLLWTFPVVKTGRRSFIPLSFLIENALTIRLIGRLTYGDDDLRRRFGKNALEAYLLQLFLNAGCYSSVRGEFAYRGRNRSEVLTPDVLAQYEDTLLMVDSKASEPKLGLRNLEEDKKIETVEIYSEHVKKLWKRMVDVGDGLVPGLRYELENIYGIVVVYKDSYVDRDDVYNRVFAELHVTDNDRELCKSHITILDMREVEVFCQYGTSLIPSLKQRAKCSESWKAITIPHLISPGAPLIDASLKIIREFGGDRIVEAFCGR